MRSTTSEFMNCQVEEELDTTEHEVLLNVIAGSVEPRSGQCAYAGPRMMSPRHERKTEMDIDTPSRTNQAHPPINVEGRPLRTACSCYPGNQLGCEYRENNMDDSKYGIAIVRLNPPSRGWRLAFDASALPFLRSHGS